MMIYYMLLVYPFMIGVVTAMNEDPNAKNSYLNKAGMILFAPLVLPIILGMIFYEKTKKL